MKCRLLHVNVTSVKEIGRKVADRFSKTGDHKAKKKKNFIQILYGNGIFFSHRDYILAILQLIFIYAAMNK